MTDTEFLHQEVFKRFILPDGTMLDYADASGRVILPTPEECEKLIPNVLGWMTGIENGAFFAGLYLYALVGEYEEKPTEDLKEDILLLTRGLLKLEEVGKVDGFVARGVGTDGKCHYPFSSEDQVGPWILGLWKLYHSEIPGKEEKDRIGEALLRTLYGIRANGYRIPTEWPGVTRGSYAGEDWRGVSKILFCAAALTELTGNPDLKKEFETLRDEKPGKSLFTRREIASHGFGPDMVRNTGLIQFWIDVCAHMCLGELCRMDAPCAEDYREGQRQNGLITGRFLEDWKRFELTDDQCKVPDFHDLSWEDCGHDPEANMERGGRHCTEIFRIFPARRSEHQVLGNMLFAAWIAGTSGEERIEKAALSALEEAVRTVDWKKLHLCYAFAAESALWQTHQAEYEQRA